jgi:hypothetical protein
MSPLNTRAIQQSPLTSLRQPFPALLVATISRTRGRADFYRAAQVFLQAPSGLPRFGYEKPLALRGCPAAEVIEDRWISQPSQRSFVDHTSGMTVRQRLLGAFRDLPFDDADLRGLFGSAGTPHHPDNLPDYDSNIHPRRPPDCVALESFRWNELETNPANNLRGPGLRRADFLDFSGGYLAQRQVQ